MSWKFITHLHQLITGRRLSDGSMFLSFQILDTSIKASLTGGSKTNRDGIIYIVTSSCFVRRGPRQIWVHVMTLFFHPSVNHWQMGHGLVVHGSQVGNPSSSGCKFVVVMAKETGMVFHQPNQLKLYSPPWVKWEHFFYSMMHQQMLDW